MLTVQLHFCHLTGPPSLRERRIHGLPSAILRSSGVGSEVMGRIASPMVGGMISSTVLTLLVTPVLYALGKRAANLEAWGRV